MPLSDCPHNLKVAESTKRPSTRHKLLLSFHEIEGKNEPRSPRTYIVIPNAHTSLSFDCLTIACPFHSSGDQNAGAPFVVVVTSPNDRLMSAAICEHPKSLMTGLRVDVMRMLSLMRVRIQAEEGGIDNALLSYRNVSRLCHANTPDLPQHHVSTFVRQNAQPQHNGWSEPG